jgi:hypothetical protein
MERAVITMHLPAHKRQALRMQTDKRWAELAYDEQIPEYIRYLQREAQPRGFRIQTDDRDWDVVLSVDERSHDDKKAAYEWLQTLPDIWNWMP